MSMARVWQEIGNGDGERLLLGWNCAAGGMGMTGRAYGAVLKDVRIGFAAQLRVWCKLPDRSLPILNSLYGKQPRLMTGLFSFGSCRGRSSSDPAWDGYGIGTARGWRAFFGGMEPCSSNMGVAICEDVAGFGQVLCARRTDRLIRGRSSAWMYDTGW